jgi:hypothetical protein
VEQWPGVLRMLSNETLIRSLITRRSVLKAFYVKLHVHSLADELKHTCIFDNKINTFFSFYDATSRDEKTVKQ